MNANNVVNVNTGMQPRPLSRSYAGVLNTQKPVSVPVAYNNYHSLGNRVNTSSTNQIRPIYNNNISQPVNNVNRNVSSAHHVQFTRK